MVDFSFLSDTNDSVIEDLSWTQDLCVLKQLSDIENSGFIDPVLSTNLESQYRKLKFFPSVESATSSGFDLKNSWSMYSGDGKSSNNFFVFFFFWPNKQSPQKELGFSPKFKLQCLLNSSSGKGNFIPPMENQKWNNGSSRAKSKCRYVSSPSNFLSTSGQIDEISISRKVTKILLKTN